MSDTLSRVTREASHVVVSEYDKLAAEHRRLALVAAEHIAQSRDLIARANEVLANSGRPHPASTE